MRRLLFLPLLLFVASMCVPACSNGDDAAGADGDGTAGADIDQLLDDYLTAWEENDVAAFEAIVSDRWYVLNEYIYEEVGSDFPVKVVSDNAEEAAFKVEFNSGWQIEQIGDRIITGDGPWFVSVAENWIPTGESETIDLEGHASYAVVEQDGILKVTNHYWAGLIVPKE